MGPAIVDLFAEHGAHVIADTRDLTRAGAVESLVDSVPDLDVLVANLAAPAHLGVFAIMRPSAQRCQPGGFCSKAGTSGLSSTQFCFALDQQWNMATKSSVSSSVPVFK